MKEREVFRIMEIASGFAIVLRGGLARAAVCKTRLEAERMVDTLTDAYMAGRESMAADIRGLLGVPKDEDAA